MTGKQYFDRGDWKFNKYNGKNTREYYVFKNGTRAMMPRYYRDKIYSEEEKELLWLQKIDKGDTWVMGEKWKYGYVFIGNFVNEKTINYISKYMLKDDLNNREFTGKVLTSAGMGKQYSELS